jgi:hypothetical protein
MHSSKRFGGIRIFVNTGKNFKTSALKAYRQPPCATEQIQ